jgi:hypothetical protein
MEVEYLTLSDAANLLHVGPANIKHLVATAKLRCGVFALGWRGHALPRFRGDLEGGVIDDGGVIHIDGEVIGIGQRNRMDRTYRFANLETGEVFVVRRAWVSQFWYVHHSSIYPFCFGGTAIEDFLIEPVDGDSLHEKDPERFPWPDFFFWPDVGDQESPIRVTWDDILFLRPDVETLAGAAMAPAPIGARARDSLLKTIGALALVVAEKGGKRYQRGDAPNAKQIDDLVASVLADLPDAARHGLGPSSIRARITAGVKLLDQ